MQLFSIYDTREFLEDFGNIAYHYEYTDLADWQSKYGPLTDMSKYSSWSRVGRYFDGVGILSSVIHGPDYRSRILPQTRNALYVTYAPDGIMREQLIGHVRDMWQSILLFSPLAETEPVRVLRARGIEEVTL